MLFGNNCGGDDVSDNSYIQKHAPGNIIYNGEKL